MTKTYEVKQTLDFPINEDFEGLAHPCRYTVRCNGLNIDYKAEPVCAFCFSVLDCKVSHTYTEDGLTEIGVYPIYAVCKDCEKHLNKKIARRVKI